ncbi:hypothetical protein, partial [Actinomadura sp. 7K534]|uniref:hypothetical protein n=1 Tax=Actinomadura sp. 7K534 TaxID=2530366 RepID=UPI00104B2100
MRRTPTASTQSRAASRERLSPVARAVYLLREAFSYGMAVADFKAKYGDKAVTGNINSAAM